MTEHFARLTTMVISEPIGTLGFVRRAIRAMFRSAGASRCTEKSHATPFHVSIKSRKMSKERIITGDQFNELLAWLDSDRDEAGHKYETIRRSLIRIFLWRGFDEAEEMSDETINRVTQKVTKIRPTFVGDPASYFYRVANLLMMEWGRRKKSHVPLEEASKELSHLEDQSDDSSGVRDREYECLTRCMAELEPDARSLILAYYQENKLAKIEHRKVLADRMQIRLNALRVRVCRIRNRLEKCIDDCLERWPE